jgi:hypothetical protein
VAAPAAGRTPLPPRARAFRRVAGRTCPDADWRTVIVTNGGEHDVELACLPVATLTGVVRQNGSPLPNAALRLLQDDGTDAGAAWGSRVRARQDLQDTIEARRVTTDELGRFRLDDLPPGRHRLHVAHRERAMPSEIAVTLAVGDNQRDVELVATIVRGRVLDQDGRAIEDAHLVVVPDDFMSRRMVHSSPQNRLFHDTFATTDGLGQFVPRGLPSEQDLVAHVTKPGHAPAWARFRVAATAPERTLELRLEPGASLIVTSSDATLAANVQVTFVANGSNADDSLEQPAGGMLQNGRLQFEDLRPGRWQVQLVPAEPATAPAPKTVELRAGATTTVTF